MEKTKGRALSGFIWNLSEKLLIQLITFIVGIILARKLGPDVYGLVATVTVIISFITIATNLYTGTYLMRKKEVDSLDMNTAFYFGLFVNVSIYFILFFTAPLLADFYGKPELVLLLRVMGISVLSSSFMGIKLVVIVRNYQYKKLFFASLVGTIIAGTLGIVFAYCGFGPWALVVAHCLDAVIDTIILWIVVKWTPKLEFSFKRLGEMIKYGSPLWLFGIADFSATRAQQLIIGKQYTSSDLAYYNRGESFPAIIETNSTSSLNDVLLRKISEEQDDFDSVRTILNKMVKLCLSISFPAMFGLAAISTVMVHLLLGDQWLSCVVFVQLFSIAFAFKPIEATSDIALKSVGKTKHFFVFGFIKKGIFLAALIVSIPFGVEAIAIGFLISSIASSLVSIAANQIVFKLNFFQQLANLLVPMAVSLVMWSFVSSIGNLMTGVSSIIVMIVQIVCGIFLYSFSLIVLDKKIVLYFKTILKNLIKR